MPKCLSNEEGKQDPVSHVPGISSRNVGGGQPRRALPASALMSQRRLSGMVSVKGRSFSMSDVPSVRHSRHPRKHRRFRRLGNLVPSALRSVRCQAVVEPKQGHAEAHESLLYPVRAVESVEIHT